MADKTLDVTGLTCPLPVLRAKKALRELSPGQTLEVLATDPGATEDFAVLSEVSGHRLLEQSMCDGVFRFVLQKAG
jgi:tRNA 2-thiouridine synthesizing protein A